MCSLYWYLGVIWCCTLSVSGTDLFKEDGVLVRDQGEVRTVSAVWQLVVLITPPIRPPVEKWFSQVREHVDKLTASRWYDNIHHWSMKLDVLHARLEQDPVEVLQVVAQRPRRGLVNAVGVAASWLFGTVSQAQLNQVQDALSSNSLQTQALKHNQEHMLSIMNRTRNIQLQLAQHFSVVERMLSLAREEAGEMKSTSNDVLLLLKIRLTVEELESVVDDYVSKRAVYHRMEMQLERGHLTETLLEKAQLVAVLEEAQNIGFRGLDLHWYYQHSKVEAVWGPDASIAFRVGLQMVSQDLYTAYQLTYLPVLLDPEHSRTVMGESVVAVSTRRKASFYPEACMGSQPMVCYPTMERTHQTCEAALVTGTRPEDCNLKVTKVKKNVSATVVAPLEGLGSVIIAPHAPNIDVTIRCAGRPPVIKGVTGPVMLQVPEACMVEGKGWLLQTLSVKHETLKVQALKPRLELPALNISWPVTLHPVMREQLQYLPELQVPLMSFDGLVHVPNGYVHTEHFDILWYCLVAMAGFIFLMSVVYLYCKCQARCRNCKHPRKGRCKVPQREETVEYERALPSSSPLKVRRDTIVRYKPRGSVLELPELPYNV